MASFFRTRLRCFYCGERSNLTKSAALREWRCDKCEAVNYLDEKGRITDPPISATRVPPELEDKKFKALEFDQAGLFCRRCVRNQHMLVAALGNYLPDIDDPEYRAYERDFPRYRRTMEERYPPVCENCEERVQDRIREMNYVAKSDHLRRMMERSRDGRAAKRARRRNWRHIIDVLGYMVFWTSFLGQVLSDVMGAVEAGDVILQLFQTHSVILVPLIAHGKHALAQIGCSSRDTAAAALIAGVLSIWWNPRLHYKVEGVNGRILGLTQYYQCQLIVIAVRFGVWMLLQDISRLQPSLPPALHAVMILFMCLATLGSHSLIRYDTRPLVVWSDSSQKPPLTSQQPQPRQTKPVFPASQQSFERFPIEKLNTAPPKTSGSALEQLLAMPEIEPEEDTMDWAPSYPEEAFRPKFRGTVEQNVVNNEPPAPSPFVGSLPPQPRPPAWQLRAPIVQRPPPPAPKANPFHYRPATAKPPSNEDDDKDASSKNKRQVRFSEPKFFPTSDYSAVTGLENLFDQTFTIMNPRERARALRDATAALRLRGIFEPDSEWVLPMTSFRLMCLLICPIIWTIERRGVVHVSSDWSLMGNLVLCILITGFSLLFALNHSPLRSPVAYYSISKFVGTLYLAGHLGLTLSKRRFSRGKFLDWSVIFLTALLTAEEYITLLSIYNQSQARKNKSKALRKKNSAQPSAQSSTQSQARALTLPSTESPVEQLTQRATEPPAEPSTQSRRQPLTQLPAQPWPRSTTQHVGNASSVRASQNRSPKTDQMPPVSPPLPSFSSFTSAFSSPKAPAPVTSTQSPAPVLSSPKQSTSTGRNTQRPGTPSDHGSDVSEAGSVSSDSERATIDERIRYMYSSHRVRPGFHPVEGQSPSLNRGLGAGLQNLSLDDSPRRVTRSQTARGIGANPGIEAERQFQALKM